MAGGQVINNFYEPLLGRYNADGTVDTTFASGAGFVTRSLSSRDDYVTELAVRDDGRRCHRRPGEDRRGGPPAGRLNIPPHMGVYAGTPRAGGEFSTGLGRRQDDDRSGPCPRPHATS